MISEANGLFDALPKQWGWEEISNLCHFIVDCLHSTPVVADDPTGYYMIRTSDVRNGRIDLGSARHVTKDVYNDRIQRGIPVEGDIVITREAPLGEVGRIPSGAKICLGQRLIHYRPNEERIVPRFLLYALVSPLLKVQFLANMGTGSIVDNLRMGEARRLKIPLPPLTEQSAIAHSLGALDDKIELNRRMNATLEAIARAIFKSWFVDFDPVHAKARGEQPYGMDAETAALFPDAFEDSELGPIPAGWGVEPLDKFIDVISGGTPKTSVSEFWSGDIPWFSVKDMPSDSDVFVIATEKSITQTGLDNSAAKLLPYGTTIISARGTVGKLALVGVPMAMNQSCYGIRGVRNLSNYYIYLLMRSIVTGLQKNTHGTVFDTITRETFSGVRVIVPPENLICAFHTRIEALFVQLHRNLTESRTLAELRDALLPKLISGNLRTSS